MMIVEVSTFGASRRGAWWAVDVVAFESSSLSKMAQSLMRHPKAPVRISVLSCGAIILQDHVELNRSMLQPTGVSPSPPQTYEFRA